MKTIGEMGLFLLCMFLLIGCSSSRLMVKNSETLDGEKLYKAKCTSCHRLLPPEKYSKEKWKEYVEKYGQKIHLNEEEMNKILEYLTAKPISP